jgi:hypothetical protein
MGYSSFPASLSSPTSSPSTSIILHRRAHPVKLLMEVVLRGAWAEAAMDRQRDKKREEHLGLENSLTEQ